MNDDDWTLLQEYVKPDGYRAVALDRSWVGPERADFVASHEDARRHLRQVMRPPILYTDEERFGDKWVSRGSFTARSLALVLRWQDGATTEDDHGLFGGVLAPQHVIGWRNEANPERFGGLTLRCGLFRLERVLAADALGPSVARYEQRTDLEVHDAVSRGSGLRLLFVGGSIADLDRETGLLAWPHERWRPHPPVFTSQYAYEPTLPGDSGRTA